MQTIKLSLDRDLIIEAVKDDTFITGQIDKSSDAVKNASLAFNEQAGDEEHHERKMLRTLRTAVSKFEANLMEFVDSSTGMISDTLNETTKSNPAFVVTINVSDRYNKGQAAPLASLAYEYIINQMLYQWWQSIRPALAKDYLAFSQESLQHIRLCLAKKAPKAADSSYTDIVGTVENYKEPTDVPPTDTDPTDTDPTDTNPTGEISNNDVPGEEPTTNNDGDGDNVVAPESPVTVEP